MTYRIDLLVVGQLKKGPYHELQSEFEKRIRWPLTIHEITSPYKDSKTQQEDEARKLLELMDDNAFIFILDERGDGLRSLDFAQTIDKFGQTGVKHIQFVIGGAEGLTDPIRDKADAMVSFGRQTWPHMMVRIMLLEQIYRAQQILAGHPYHRE